MHYTCSVCGDRVKGDLIVFKNHTDAHIIEAIKERHPDWSEQDGLCPKCVDYYRAQMKG